MPDVSIRNYLVVTGGYWAFTVTDGGAPFTWSATSCGAHRSAHAATTLSGN